jgi:hypothetical protein
MLEVHVPVRVWRFKSSRPHQSSESLRADLRKARHGSPRVAALLANVEVEVRTRLLKRVPSRLAFRIEAVVLMLRAVPIRRWSCVRVNSKRSFSFVVLVLEPCKSAAVHIFRQYPDEVVEQVEQIPSLQQAVLAEFFIESSLRWTPRISAARVLLP